MEIKSQIRKACLRSRDAIAPDLCKEKSHAITKRIFQSKLFTECDAIAAYSAIRSEVNLQAIFPVAYQQKKALFLPKVNGALMEFYRVDEKTPLQEGSFHVMEPQQTADTLSLPEYLHQTPDGKLFQLLILCPGVAFGTNGDRIGYGRGYYDRYLGALAGKGISFTTIGICYEAQLLDSYHGEALDWKMDYIITESREEKCYE